MIEINGKVYRNLQEQVKKNMDDIAELQQGGGVTVDAYTKAESDAKFQTIAGMTDYVTQTELTTDLADKQDTLVSGTNIKTINNQSLLGEGNITIGGGGGSYTSGTGITIDSLDVISVDNTVVPYKTDLSIYAESADLATVATTGDYEDLTNTPTIPDAVSGTNDGTNWTSLTIGSDTYGLASGGGSSYTAGTGIDITSNTISVDNTVAMKADEKIQYLASVELRTSSNNNYKLLLPAYAPAGTTFTGTTTDFQYIYVGSSGAAVQWNSSASTYAFYGLGTLTTPTQFVAQHGSTQVEFNFTTCTFLSIAFSQPNNISFTA